MFFELEPKDLGEVTMLLQKILVAAAASALLPLCPGSVSAEPTQLPAASAPTLTAWSQRVYRDLDRELRVPIVFRSEDMSEGIVAVKFGCSDSGAPSSVTLFKSSGDRRLDSATLLAVSKIATLHPLPSRLRHDQQYIVRVLFANDASSAERQIRKMQAEAAKNNAWYDKNSSDSMAAIELAPVG